MSDDTQAALEDEMKVAFVAWFDALEDGAREKEWPVCMAASWEAAWLAASRSIPTAVEEIKAAYKQGWNDRESDILERADSMGLPDPVPAAAALLREAGWAVEEPRGGACAGIGFSYTSDWPPVSNPCPTCNGTGKRA